MKEINNRSNEIPMLSVLARNPLMASTISKAIEQPSNAGASSVRDLKTGALVSLAEMHQMSQEMQQSIQNYESFFQLFPDMNIDRAIVTGGVLAPNNMFREELNYTIENKEIDPLIAGKVLEFVKQEIEARYNFVQELREIVDNALFYRGAHVKLILPEAAVDYMINSPSIGGGMRMESAVALNRMFDTSKSKFSMGLLGNPGKKEELKYRGESFQKQASSYNPQYTPSSPKWDKYPEFKNLASKAVSVITDDLSVIKKPFYVTAASKMVVRDRIDAERRGIELYRQESYRQESVNGDVDTLSGKTQIGEKHTDNTRIDTVDTRKGMSTDSGDINLSRLQAAIFKSAPTNQEFFGRIPRLNNLKRHSIGECLYIDAPMEAFIPVHYPGQPKEHLGYLALIDRMSGYFVSLETSRQYLASFNNQANPYMTNVTSNTGNSSSLSTSMVGRASQNLVNHDQTSPLRYHPEIFGSILMEDCLERIANGTIGFELEAKMASMMAYVTMARSFAGRQTEVVFIPAEFVSYFAFDHNANGTGRSMLAGVTNLLSLRAAALYSRVANQIRNAISITDVKVTLDERDHQPQRTLMKIVDLVTQSRAQFFPWGLNSASDIWSWWNKAGYQLNVEGHPAIPRTKIEYEQRKHDHNLPDIADDSYIKDMVGHHFGITPEMKDAGTGADFATSVVNNNILFANREHALQQKLNPQLTSHIRKLTYNDSEIYAGVRGIVKDNWGGLVSKFSERFKKVYGEFEKEDDAIDNFTRVVVDSIRAELPPPEVTTIQNQSTAFNEFSDAVDKTFDAILADEALSKIAFGEDPVASVELAKAYKAQFKRNWMRNNGYMTELLSIAETDKDGKPTSKLLREAVEFSMNFQKNTIAVTKEFKASGQRAQIDMGLLSGTMTEEEAQQALLQLQNPEAAESAQQQQDPGITDDPGSQEPNENQYPE